MSIEAMKLALEALDCIYSPLHVREINKVGAAMLTLRQAIEQAEQAQPVAWQYSFTHSSAIGHGDYDIGPLVTDKKDVAFGVGCFGQIPLYTSPPPRQPLTWQPIETAPKDGTDILVMYMHIDTQVVHNGFWIEADEDQDELETGWWSYEHSEVSRIKLDDWMEPTHWLPLPAHGIKGEA